VSNRLRSTDNRNNVEAVSITNTNRKKKSNTDQEPTNVSVMDILYNGIYV
jgi:hypothetical protein